MSRIELQEAVVDLWDAIPVPAPDLEAVRKRVSRDRRRHVRRVSVVAAACVGITGLAGLWTAQELGTREPDIVLPFSTAEIEPALPFPMVQRNRLVLANPDGTLVATGIGAQEVLGQSRTDVVVYTNRSHVVSVEVAADGSVGEQSDLSGGPVVATAISQDGSTVAYVDLESVLTLRRVHPSAPGEIVFSAPVPTGAQLVDAENDSWVIVNRERTALSIHRLVGEDAQEVEVQVNDGMLSQAELAGDIIAIPTLDNLVQVLDARTGAHILGHSTGSSGAGAISPDGRLYVATAGPSVAPRLIAATRENESTTIKGIAEGALVGRVFWQGTTRFYLSTVEETAETIWTCTVRANCSRLLTLDRQAGPVELPYG